MNEAAWSRAARVLEALAELLAGAGDALGEAGLFAAMCAIIARAMGIEGTDVVSVTHDLVNARGGDA
jgi:hypothetical protein